MKRLFAPILPFLILLAMLSTACTKQPATYRVGVSQCLDDAWRQKMNEEMARELMLNPHISLETRIAYGSSELQCAQIDSFISEKVDLLIVSPNEAEEVKPAVTRAYRCGIPVIVVDRRVTGDEWTAFIGGDNRRVGELMGEWLIQLRREQKHTLHVLEVCGLPGSTPTILRHEGMARTIREQDIQIESVEGKWMKDDACEAVKRYLATHSHVEAIVAQNDLMAIGAAEAVQSTPGYGEGSVRIMGVDGILLGLQAIVDGVIECTATYSSRGDMVIQTATNILGSEPYLRDTILETTMIDESAARAMLLQRREHMHDIETLKMVQRQADDIWHRMRVRTDIIVVCFVLVCCIFMVMLTYMFHTHRKLQAEIKEEVVPQMADMMEALKLNSRDVAFREQLVQYVDAHLEDADLNVETLGKEFGLSRTQIFRRVKTVSGKGPLEYIRERRLIKADALLHSTDMTVQQVAHTFCFSTPGYFSHCYKEYFGHLPSER